MLVLSRRERERIKLGDSIVVTVVRVSGDKVRLGIEAPPDVLVLRDELEPRTRERALGREQLNDGRNVEEGCWPGRHGTNGRPSAGRGRACRLRRAFAS